MKPSATWTSLALACLLSASCVCAVPLQNPPLPIQVRGATPVSPGAHCVQFNLGEIDAELHTPLARSLQIANTGGDPITVEGVETSCGCTSAFFDCATLPFALRPSQVATLSVVLDASELQDGQISKWVTINLRGKALTSLQIVLIGHVHHGCYCIPPSIDYGKIRAGDPGSVRFFAYCPAGWALVTHSDSPFVAVSSHRDGAAVSGLISFKCVARLSRNAPGGVLDGSVYCTATPNSHGKASTATVPVHGEVDGPVSAEPATLGFGPIMFGQGAFGTVALHAQHAALLQNLSVHATLPYIHVRVIYHRSAGIGSRSPYANIGGTRAPHLLVSLDVALAAFAPPGLLTGRVLVSGQSGIELEIPVSGLIIARSHP